MATRAWIVKQRAEVYANVEGSFALSQDVLQRLKPRPTKPSAWPVAPRVSALARQAFVQAPAFVMKAQASEPAASQASRAPTLPERDSQFAQEWSQSQLTRPARA